MDSYQKNRVLTKKLNEYTSNVTPGQMTAIGDDEVKHYYRVFVNREPDEVELKIYRNHPDNAQLVRDLRLMRKNNTPSPSDGQGGKCGDATHAQYQGQGGCKHPSHSSSGQGGPIDNFSSLLAAGANRVGQSLGRVFAPAVNTARRAASSVSSLVSGGTSGKGFRTDRHNNPTAFTTAVARDFGLVPGVDYVEGDTFPNNPNLRTAKLLGDPIATTIKGIDRGGFYTASGKPRWTYTNSISGVNNWKNLTYGQKAAIIAQMYKHEGGNGQLLSPYMGSGGGQGGLSALSNLGNITTNFGGQTKDTNFHTGVDVANQEGTVIPKLGGPGQVMSVGPNGDYGNQLTIKNDDGTVESYSHLRKSMVRPGQRVVSMQPLAAMGKTGNAYSTSGGDPSHLHYEISNAYQQLINPMNYLRNK